MMQREKKEFAINQAQIYDDLSALVVTFKKLASLAESVIICIQKGSDHASLLLKIKGLLETLDPLKEKYKVPSEQHYIQELTFYRFGHRLLEVINFMKNKSQNRSDSHGFFLLNTCLRQIQESIRHCKESKQFFQLIKRIQNSFAKFCKHCQAPANVFSEKVQNVYEQGINQKEQKVTKSKVNEYKCQKSIKLKHFKTQVNQSSSQDSEATSEKGLQIGRKKRQNWLLKRQYSKQLTKLQKRFDTLYQLDLDLSYFNSVYYSAKGNQQLFFRQYLQKNLINKRIIANYYDDFWLFIRKRSYKYMRKDRINTKSDTNKQQNQNNSFDILQRQIQLQNRIEEESRSLPSKDKIKSLTNPLKLQQQYPSKLLNYDRGNKRQLKMKNLQITILNMSKEGKQAKVHSNFNYKKSKLEPVCINQSYYNDLESQAQTSLLFLQRKLKVESDLNKYQKKDRQKQSKNDKSDKQLQSLSQVSKQSNLLNQASNSKFSLKEKHLQISNRRRKREQQDRIFFSKQRSTIHQVSFKNVNNMIKRESQGKLVICNQKL